MKTFAIINHKGGVGKTTVALNIAGTLAEMGYKTLAIDCDSQGDLSAVLTEEHQQAEHSVADLFTDNPPLIAELAQATAFDNLSVITADRRLNVVEQTHGYESSPTATCLADALSEIKDDYDFAVFDCATKPHLTGYAAMVAADEVIVPCQPSQFSLRSLATIHEQLQHARAINPQIGIRYLLSQGSARSKTAQQVQALLADTFGQSSVFQNAMHKSAAIDTAINVGKPLVFHSRRSKATQATRDFVMELIGAHYEKTSQPVAA